MGRNYQFIIASNKINELFKAAEPVCQRLISYNEYNTNDYTSWYNNDQYNYDDDLKLCESNYNQIIKLADGLLNNNPSSSEFRVARILAEYSLGTLYTGNGNYEKGLTQLNQAISEFDSSEQKLIEMFYCEYADCYIKKGKCCIEKRDDIEIIEACHEDAAWCLNQGKLSANHTNAFYTRYYMNSDQGNPDRLVYKTPNILKADIHAAQVRLYVDKFDRCNIEKNKPDNAEALNAPKKDALDNLRLHLQGIEDFLITSKSDSYIEEHGKPMVIYPLSKSCKKIVIPYVSQRGNDAALKKKKRAGRDYYFYKIVTTYLTTRGLYHLKKYQYEVDCQTNSKDNTNELGNALRYFKKAYYYDSFNTIAMDNIAFILLRFWDEIYLIKSEPQHEFCKDVENVFHMISNSQEGIRTGSQIILKPSLIAAYRDTKKNRRRLKLLEDLYHDIYPYCPKGDIEKFDGSKDIKYMAEEVLSIAKNFNNTSIAERTSKILHENEESESEQVNAYRNVCRNIYSFLEKVLEIEPCNMYALNLRNLLERNPVGQRLDDNVFEIYTSLRLSTLKKRLQNLDWYLYDISNDIPKDQIILTDLKVSLIELYNEISKFSGATIVDLETANPEIGHYTKMKVLRELVNSQNATKLHLSNIPYLNDPREGMILLDMLAPLSSEDKNSGEPDKLKDRVYRLYNSSELRRNYVYIGCFTGNLDSLAMWERYGDKGEGVCFVVDAQKSFDKSQAVDLNYIYTEDNINDLKSMDGKYALHRVVYYPDSKHDGYCLRDIPQLLENRQMDYERIIAIAEEELKRIYQLLPENDLCKFQNVRGRFRDILEKQTTGNNDLSVSTGIDGGRKDELKASISELYNMDILTRTIQNVSWILEMIQSDLDFLKKNRCQREENWYKFENQVIGIIMLLLDQIRYLVKSSYYKDEEEYRVIKYSSSPKCDNSREGVPMVYVEMKKPLKYKKIYIGPKAKDPVSVGAYILNIKRELEYGSVQPDIIVQKSTIPYQ